MRMKEFIAFWIIFTIVYIVFFVVYDKISDRVLEKRIIKRAFSLMDISSYQVFSQFYGLNGTATLNILQDIYIKYRNENKIVINVAAAQYNITPYEFAVIYLYFEYINIFNKRMIQFETGMIYPLSFDDSTIVNKYHMYFTQRADFRTIYSALGEGVRKDLSYIESMHLVPGVRFVDSVLYYVGDLK